MFFLAVLVPIVIIASNAQAMDLVNDPALVGLWLFDDGSGGIVTDSSGNGNDGAINGDFTWDTGKIGGALIAADTGSIEVPVSASLDTVTSAMTLAGWFRIDADSNTGIRRQNAFLLEDQSTLSQYPMAFPSEYGLQAASVPAPMAQPNWRKENGTTSPAHTMVRL